MKDAKFFNSDNIPLALSNLYFRDECTVTEILDAVEDSKTAEELAERLNNLKLFEKFVVDRKTDKYIRLRSVGAFGGIHYFKAYYD